MKNIHNLIRYLILAAFIFLVNEYILVEDETTEPGYSEVKHDANVVREIPFDLSMVPEYTNKPYAVVHDNEPYFTDEEMTSEAFEDYATLDDLKRCDSAVACLGIETMPTEKRESISSVKPSGWVQAQYDFVDGKSLYNRCHLIGFQLSAENANERNLITGTRYINVQGMLPFENMVADYIKETHNHVMYRITPIFTGNNLVCDGVLMEAKSVEDNGKGVSFCVYTYNVQPGVKIDYKTGRSSLDVVYVPESGGSKYHSMPSCSDMKKSIQLTRYEAKQKGYSACKRCN